MIPAEGWAGAFRLNGRPSVSLYSFLLKDHLSLAEPEGEIVLLILCSWAHVKLFEDAGKPVPLAKQCQTLTLKKTAVRNDNQVASGVQLGGHGEAGPNPF